MTTPTPFMPNCPLCAAMAAQGVPPELPVIFRMDKGGKHPEVTAVFPTEVERNGDVGCYAHVGQHGTCSRGWYETKTRPATPEEYAPLLSELRALYERGPGGPVRLKVTTRFPRKGGK